MPDPVTEDAPLQAHTLPYAIHKKESDLVVQPRTCMRGCGVFVLRPHTFRGTDVENYLLGADSGERPTEKANARFGRGKRLPCMLPFAPEYVDNKIPVHPRVPYMARLIAAILVAANRKRGAFL